VRIEVKSLSRRISFLAESLAVGTAASFILSGLANAAIFKLVWNLNYFVIATPSDVVMTAFIFMALLLIVAIPLSAIILWITARARTAAAQRQAWHQTELKSRMGANQRTKRGGRHAVDPEIELAVERSIAEAHRQERRRNIANLGTALLSVVATVAAYWFTFTTDADPAPPARGNPALDRQFSYATGLRLAPTEATGPDCWAAPVLWMGTDRMVLGCQPGVRVVTVSDTLVLQSESLRVPSRPLFLLQRENDSLSDVVQRRLRGVSSEDQTRTILELLIQNQGGPTLPASTERPKESTASSMGGSVDSASRPSP